MITYTDSFGTTWSLVVKLDNYRNNDNLYVGLVVAEDVYDYEEDDIVAFKGEPYADLSVNIQTLPENCIAVDCTWGDYCQLIEDNDLGTYTGRDLMSGYCSYPVYEMNMAKLQENTI